MWGILDQIILFLLINISIVHILSESRPSDMPGSIFGYFPGQFGFNSGYSIEFGFASLCFVPTALSVSVIGLFPWISAGKLKSKTTGRIDFRVNSWAILGNFDVLKND